jgi:hypothetical protein
MKKLEREAVPSDIFCDMHNDEPVMYYHKGEDRLQCIKCACQPMEVVRADFKAIDKTSKRLSKLLSKKKNLINVKYQEAISIVEQEYKEKVETVKKEWE